MCTTVAMRTLVDHECTVTDLNFVGAKVVNNFRTIKSSLKATFGNSVYVQRTNTSRSSVQNEKFSTALFSKRLCGSQNSLTVSFVQCALTNDDDTIGALFIRVIHRQQLLKRCAVGANVGVIVGQIDSFTNQTNSCATQPRFADTGVQNWRFNTWVGADHENVVSVIDVFDQRGADISGTVTSRQTRLVGTRLNLAAQTFDQGFEAECGFDVRQIANQTSDFLALHRRSNSGQSFVPASFAQLAVLADIRRVQTLAAQAVPNVTRLIGNPLFVYAIVVARQDTHDLAAFGINADVRTKRIHHVDGFGLGQFPRTSGERVRFRNQSTNRAEVNDVALHVRIECLVQVRCNLCIFATARLTHLGDTSDLSGKAHTPGARNTTGHVGFNERAEVQVVRRTFRFAVAREVYAVSHCLILKVAFATLVTDRAIQRVVDQEKLHHAFTRLFNHWAVGFHNRRLTLRARAQVFDLHRTGGRRFRRAADHLNEAHAAVARDGQTLVIAETRNFNPSLFTGLNQGHGTGHFYLNPVDDDFLKIGHGQPFGSCRYDPKLRMARTQMHTVAAVLTRLAALCQRERHQN